MTGYSPGAVTSLKKEIAYAAITRTMKDQLWHGSAETGYSSDLVQGSYPPVNGPTGEVELRALGVRGNVPPTKVNPWEDVYKPWIDRIDQAFTYWDQLPDPADFDGKLNAAHDAVFRLTLGSGDKEQGGSDIGDATTSTSIAFVDKWIGPATPGAVDSATVRAFDQYYGAARLRLVTTSQRELMIVLGLALAGEKQTWAKARTDLMTVMDGAKAAFEEGPDLSDSLGIFLALVDLIASFATGGAATALGVLSAAGGLVAEVLPKDNGTTVSKPLAGDHADDVYHKMLDALTTISDGIRHAEEELSTMLTKASGQAGNPTYHDSYHIGPGAGLAPGVGDAKPNEIRGRLDIYRQVGYEMMPNIAGEMGRSAVSLTTCRNAMMWSRPYVFGTGSQGPFQEWSDLYDIADSVVLSSAHEIVLAGQKLAQAAGFLSDADGTSTKALKGVAAQVDGAGLDWDITDSTPPDYIRLPGGKMIPQ